MKYLKLFESNNTFKKNVTIDLVSYGITYKSNEVDEITTSDIDISFLIDMEYREWGIKSISIYNFQGPKEIELEVKYYGENDEELYKTIKVSLDWEKVIIEKSNEGTITVDSVQIELINGTSNVDTHGRLISGDIGVKTITIKTNEL